MCIARRVGRSVLPRRFGADETDDLIHVSELYEIWQPVGWEVTQRVLQEMNKLNYTTSRACVVELAGIFSTPSRLSLGSMLNTMQPFMNVNMFSSFYFFPLHDHPFIESSARYENSV